MGLEPTKSCLASIRNSRYATSANWSGWHELHMRPPGSGPGRLLLTYTLNWLLHCVTLADLPLIRRMHGLLCYGAMSWSGRQDLHLRPPSSKLGRLLLTYALILELPVGLAPTALPLCRRPHWLLWHGSIWGDGMESNHLQQCHKLRAMPFAFRHVIGTTGGHRTHSHAG